MTAYKRLLLQAIGTLRHTNKPGQLVLLSLCSVFLLAGLLQAGKLSAAELARQAVNLSSNSFTGDILSTKSTALFARKTLKADTLSIKSKIESVKIDDESTEQVSNAENYSESQTKLSLGVDYLYYDSSVSFSGGYGKVESTNISDLAIDLSQEYANGSHHLLMGFSHAWQNDSELGMHNKSRQLRLGSSFGLRPTWILYTGFELSNLDGDLENFRSARRFQDATRTQLPDGRSDQRLQIISKNDIGKQQILTTTIARFKNDWQQSGESYRLSYLKNRSQQFSLKTHIAIFQQSKSKFYLASIAGSPQNFFSDHRHMAKQSHKEIGLTGRWRFKQKIAQHIGPLRLDLGYTYIKSKYDTDIEISNSGSLIHLNLTGAF